MEKLVRKNIPGIMRSEGQRPHHVRIATPQELPGLMADKIIEEALEVNEAIRNGNRRAEIEEIADLQQVLEDIMIVREFTPQERAETERIRLKKLTERGGFTEGVVVEFPGEKRFP